MNIQHVLDNFRTWKDSERKQLSPVFAMLSGVSKKTLMTFQNNWDGSEGYDAFVKAQNDQIETCIRLELSETGRIVREKLGLDPLTLETEIGVPSPTV